VFTTVRALHLCAFLRFKGIFRKIPVSRSTKIAEDRCGDSGLRTSLLVFHVKSATGCDHAGVPLCIPWYPVALIT